MRKAWISRRRFGLALSKSALALAVLPGCRTFSGGAPRLGARFDDSSGQIAVSDGDHPVFRYNYWPGAPGAVLDRVSAANRKYAVTRSDYIHPLYGPGGEELTCDWPVDHPHHRGIYWAWPEVDWRGNRGDLHALQKVFARPIGQPRLKSGVDFAEVDAENLWVWETGEAIVRERAVLRAFRATAQGRAIHLRFEFRAVKDLVLVARRETTLYGGLNLRLGASAGQVLNKHQDPATTTTRMAWSDVCGRFQDAAEPCGVAVFQHPANPDYPGDWVEYPELAWLQPTFPASGKRYELSRDRSLVLRYRLFIHSGGPLNEDVARQQWSAGAAAKDF